MTEKKIEVTLAPMLEADYETIVRWINAADQEFMVQWAGPTFVYPLSVEQLQQHYSKGVHSLEANVIAYKIAEKAAGSMIGMVQLCRFDFAAKEAFIGRFLIGDPAYRGKGAGSSALSQTLEVGFLSFNLNRIGLNVYAWNTAAIHCYERAGFQLAQVTTDAYRSRNGTSWDNCRMFLDKDTWLASTAHT